MTLNPSEKPKATPTGLRKGETSRFVYLKVHGGSNLDSSTKSTLLPPKNSASKASTMASSLTVTASTIKSTPKQELKSLKFSEEKFKEKSSEKSHPPPPPEPSTLKPFKKARKVLDSRFKSDLANRPAISSFDLVASEMADFVAFVDPEEDVSISTTIPLVAPSDAGASENPVDTERDPLDQSQSQVNDADETGKITNPREDLAANLEESVQDVEDSAQVSVAPIVSPVDAPLEDVDVEDVFETVELVYPGAAGLVERFPLVVPKSKQDYSPLHDLLTSVQFIGQECLKPSHAGVLGTVKTGAVRAVIKACHRKSPRGIRESVDAFDRLLKTCMKEEGFWEWGSEESPRLSHDFCKHVLEQSYARTVAPKSHLLREYEGFSNNVYGEITPLFVAEIIRNAEIEPNSVFLDMGSGTGNVVLQVAGEVCCESYGIEIMENPASLAKKQRAEFLSRMRMYGKACGRIFLKQGDFLQDEGIHSVITRSDVIFVNNYAFHADVNLALLAKFLDVKPTCRIVSLRSFVSQRPGASRATNSIETKFRVKEFRFPRNSVSWMPEGGSYYIHYVNQ